MRLRPALVPVYGEHASLLEVSGPLPALAVQDLALGDLLEAAAGPSPVETPEPGERARALYQVLGRFYLQVAPVPALRELQERGGEAVAAQVARTPDPQASQAARLKRRTL